MENFNENKLDALFITETWLQNTDEDDTWLQASEFCKDDYKIININRQAGEAQHYCTPHYIQNQNNNAYKYAIALKAELGTSNLDTTLHTIWCLPPTSWNTTRNNKQHCHQ